MSDHEAPADTIDAIRTTMDRIMDRVTDIESELDSDDVSAKTSEALLKELVRIKGYIDSAGTVPYAAYD